jgi:hypothetical protein
VSKSTGLCVDCAKFAETMPAVLGLFYERDSAAFDLPGVAEALEVVGVAGERRRQPDAPAMAAGSAAPVFRNDLRSM